MFPEILHIDDVLKHVENKPEFIHVVRDDYMYVDYVYVTPDTFTHPIHLECRGIKFNKYGQLIARPFHKFFNLGEREDCRGIQEGHTIMHKLDGSMIHPVLIDNRMSLMTRKGYSEHAMFADKLIEDNLLEWGLDFIDFCRMWMENGFTPIFEFTTPKFRIVIPYPEHRLTLLAVRENHSGRYVNRDVIEKKAKQYNISTVQYKDLHPDVLVEHVRDLKDEEGVVLRWDDGHMLKIKADDYVAMHRTKSVIDSEKGVKHVVLNNLLDDVLPLCDDYTKDRLKLYAARVGAWIALTAASVNGTVNRAHDNGADRKTFALEYVSKLNDGVEKALAFKMFDSDEEVNVVLLDMLKENPSKLPVVWNTDE